MKDITLKEMITEDTYCNYGTEDIDGEVFDLKFSELDKSKYWCYRSDDKVGDYAVLSIDDWVFVYSEETMEVKALLSVYELHGFKVIPEKDMILVYGHEQILVYFSDGFKKEIRTR